MRMLCVYINKNVEDHRCLNQAKTFIVRAFPYLKQVRISFQSGLKYQESIVQAISASHSDDSKAVFLCKTLDRFY